jgi:glutathione synthase
MSKTSPLKILFVADPLSRLKLSSDTSLALAQAVLENSGRVFWCEPHQVGLFGNNIVVSLPIELEGISTQELKLSPRQGAALELLTSFTHVFVRKDPPFNEEYKDLCWLLASQNQVPVLNSAESLLNFHEKTLHLRAHAEGVLEDSEVVPTCVSREFSVLRQFVEMHMRWNETDPKSQSGFIVKPWLGHGGEDVQLFKDGKDCIDHLASLAGNQSLLSQRIIVQPFLPEIHTEGDRRVIIANGEVVCDFVRLPAAGKIAANLAQGGSAILADMSSQQKNLCARLARFLKVKGVHFAGLDLIGAKVTEINITSPTGIRTYETLSGINYSQHILKLLLQGPL